MPIIPYCVVEGSAVVSPPHEGVGGASVMSVETQGLCAFYSVVTALPSDAKTVQAEALRFHGVIAAIFKHCAVVQFRFPTALDSAEALREQLQQHGDEYRGFLARVRDLLQMEIRISAVSAPPPATTSGREYLLSKHAAVRAEENYADKLRSATEDLICEWKTRKTQNAFRCYALVCRRDAEAFRQRIQQVLSSSSAVHAVLSGPWPETEFLDANVKA